MYLNAQIFAKSSKKEFENRTPRSTKKRATLVPLFSYPLLSYFRTSFCVTPPPTRITFRRSKVRSRFEQSKMMKRRQQRSCKSCADRQKVNLFTFFDYLHKAVNCAAICLRLYIADNSATPPPKQRPRRGVRKKRGRLPSSSFSYPEPGSNRHRGEPTGV